MKTHITIGTSWLLRQMSNPEPRIYLYWFYLIFLYFLFLPPLPLVPESFPRPLSRLTVYRLSDTTYPTVQNSVLTWHEPFQNQNWLDHRDSPSSDGVTPFFFPCDRSVSVARLVKPIPILRRSRNDWPILCSLT